MQCGEWVLSNMITKKGKNINRKFMVLLVIFLLILVASIGIFKHAEYKWAGSLIDAVRQNDITKAEQLLLKKCYSIDAQGKGSWLAVWVEPINAPETSLQVACDESKYDFVKLFIDNGADVNKEGSTRLTPLLYTLQSTESDDYKIVESLVKNGADVDEWSTEGQPPLIAAASMSTYKNDKYNQKKAKEIVKIYSLLLKYAENKVPEERDYKGNALMAAVNMNNLELIEYISNAQHININSKDKLGWTSLFYIEPDNKKDNTDISIKVARLLIKLGADKSIKDNKGKTAYDYALENKYEYLAKVLKP